MKLANEFLDDMYRGLGVKEEDLRNPIALLHALDGKVVIPNYPAGEKPSLKEKEEYILRENGYMI